MHWSQMRANVVRVLHVSQSRPQQAVSPEHNSSYPRRGAGMTETEVIRPLGPAPGRELET